MIDFDTAHVRNLGQPKLNLDVPMRSVKPRNVGMSNLLDSGYGLSVLDDTLSFCHPFIDVVKLGWGSAYVTSTLREKVELFRRYEVKVCFGGTLFEVCWSQNKVNDYAAWLADLDVDLVEISNGSLDISEADKRKMIEFFAGRGFTVFAEVGSKDIAHQNSPSEWAAFSKADLEAGAWKVILEGRADATAGVYREDGSLQNTIVEAVLDVVPTEKLVFEAPHKSQMTWFIQRVGSNANIGNIPLEEVLNLETLRLGLRGDTVRHFHGT